MEDSCSGRGIPTARQKLGRIGENAALAHLQAHGLELVTRNYRCKAGELDLVMTDGGTLVLLEVRYRSRENFGGAAVSVDWRKQQRLVRAAQHLLLTHAHLRRYPARFDVIALAPGSGGPRIHWIKNAFTL